jgi:hypothetical protein
MAAPLIVQASDFVGQVHKPLHAKLHRIGATPTSVDIVSSDRLSLIMTSGRSTRAKEGMDKQIALLSDRFPTDPVVQRYANLPSGLFRFQRKDPDALERDLNALGLTGCWVTHADLYPDQAKKPFAALVLIDRQLFVRINASGGTREITMVDGSVHNSVGLLQQQLVRALGPGKVLRSSDDPMRFSRDTLAAEGTIDACTGSRWKIAFGSWVFDLEKGSTAAMTLRSLVQIGQIENELRARKTASHALRRAREGLTYLPEVQLPAGVVLELDGKGKPVKRMGAHIPTFDPRVRPIIEKAVEMHARGDRYGDIGMYLAEQDLPMRGHRSTEKTYRSVLQDPYLSPVAKRSRLASMAKKFFTVATVRDLAWVSPSDPQATDVDRFFASVYTGKLDLWSTGRYVTARRLGVLRGTSEIAGQKVLYLPGSEIGHLPLPCNWFTDEAGQSTLDITLSSADVAASRQRLLDERGSRARTGGGAHHRERTHWLTHVPTWLDGDYDYSAPPCDNAGNPKPTDVRTHRLIPSDTSDDSATYQVRTRPAHQSLTRVKGAWEERAGFDASEGEIAFTMSAAELAPSVAEAIESGVVDHLRGRPRIGRAPSARPTLTSLHQLHTATLRDQLSRAQATESGARLARDEARGEVEVARARGEADPEAEAELARAQHGLDTAIERLRTAETAHDEALDHPSSTSSASLQAALGLAAYLAALFRRTGDEDGRMASHDAQLVEKHLINWRFTAGTEGQVTWACQLRWDADDADAVMELTGCVDDIHLRKGKASGARSRQRILVDGLSVDEFMLEQRVRRNRAGIVSGLERHLTEHLSTKVRGAIIDHPFADVRSFVYRRGVLHQPLITPEGWTDRFAEHLLAVMTADNPQVRKAAAVPQRVDNWHALQLGLVRIGGTTTTKAVARQWKVTYDAALTHLRNQVGFAAYAPFGTTRDTVSLIECPYTDCAERYASHLCALPEVLVTGTSAICPGCRRVPVPVPAWSDLEFPEQYVNTRWTRVVAVVKKPGSPFGPLNPPPAEEGKRKAPSSNPTTLLCQRQTIPWNGRPLILPRPPRP